MRIDSCRKCGDTLQVLNLCSVCNQASEIECNSCNAFVDNPIHNHQYLTSQSFLQVGVNGN